MSEWLNWTELNWRRYLGFPGASVIKNLPANTGDIRDSGSIPTSGRSPGEGHGNPLQYSCLENSMDRGAWRATVHTVTNSQTPLRRLTSILVRRWLWVPRWQNVDLWSLILCVKWKNVLGWDLYLNLLTSSELIAFYNVHENHPASWSLEWNINRGHFNQKGIFLHQSLSCVSSLLAHTTDLDLLVSTIT